MSNIDITQLVTADQKLAAAKTSALSRIKSALGEAMASGVCTLSLGWQIDARRSGVNDDVANMQGLLTLAQSQGLSDTAAVPGGGIKGHDNSMHPVTVAELRDHVIPEMIAYGLSLYQKKWDLGTQIAAAATLSDLDAVVWS